MQSVNSRILIIMPTRGRPWSALEAIASVFRTADEPDRIGLLVCQDEDDRGRFKLSRDSQSIHTVIGERRSFIGWLNEGVTRNVIETSGAPCPWSHVAWLGDDVRYRTKGWDTIVRSYKELVVFGDDRYRQAPSHPFIRTEIPKALGFFIPSGLMHYCADGFIWALAGELKSITRDDRIVTDHMHPDAGKADRDNLYVDTHKAHWDNDLKTLDVHVRPKIAEWAQQVTHYCYGEAKPKKD